MFNFVCIFKKHISQQKQNNAALNLSKKRL